MSSNIRQEYRSFNDRQTHRNDYIAFLDASKYYADVFQRMIDKIQRMANDVDSAADKVLKQGHF